MNVYSENPTWKCRSSITPSTSIQFIPRQLDRGGVVAMGMNQEFLPIGHADLIENAGQMMADRTVRNTQSVGDVFVRKSLADQSDNLPFAFSQSIGPLRWLCVGVDIPLGKGRLQIRAQRVMRFDMGGGIQRLNDGENGRRRLDLQNDPVDTVFKSLSRTIRVIESAQQHDLAVRRQLPHLSHRAERV